MSVEQLRRRVEEASAIVSMDWDTNAARYAEWFGSSPTEWARWRVHAQDAWVFELILAHGGEARAACQVFVAPLTEEIRRTQARNPHAVEPNLSIVGMMHMLQCLGLEVDPEAAALAIGWLIGMDTARMEPPWFHWGRGLAGLAYGQPRVYRPVAGFLPNEPVPMVDPTQSSVYNVQAWLAYFAGAVEAGASFADVEPTWRVFLGVYEDLVADDVLSPEQLVWFARIVHHTIGGHPLGDVADWLYHYLRQAVGLE